MSITAWTLLGPVSAAVDIPRDRLTSYDVPHYTRLKKLSASFGFCDACVFSYVYILKHTLEERRAVFLRIC